jgi:hypothetical protein
MEFSVSENHIESLAERKGHPMTKTILTGVGIASLLSFVFIGTAVAQPSGVPNLNVRPVCRGIAQQAATPGERGGPDLGYGQCIQSEMATRRKLIHRWARYTPDEKASCIGSTTGGFASYTDLATCLEMAKEARKFNN